MLTADTVEWCPRDGLHQILAGGTYQLDEKAGVRRGTLALYEWNHARYIVRMRKDKKFIVFPLRMQLVADTAF